MENSCFFRADPEGAVIVALDSQEDGFLSGAVELRGGSGTWLDYELEPTPYSDMVSLYRGAEDAPVLVYRVKGRRIDIVTPPERLLIFWNRGRRALAADGEPLFSGELSASAPEGTAPWLLRYASWLPERE